MKNPSIQDNPFLPLTIRRAILHPPELVTDDPTISIRSHLHQSNGTNQQVIHRPISQILHK